MGMYNDYMQYFREIAISNLLIKHADTPTIEKFFEFSIEQVILGSMHNLPGFDHGPFMIYSGFIERFSFTDKNLKNLEFMFFIQQGVELKNWQQQREAMDTCKICVDQIISKMIHDSTNDDYETILEQSFNRADSVNIIPNIIETGGKKYVGYQVSFVIKNEFTYCYNPLDWQ